MSLLEGKGRQCGKESSTSSLSMPMEETSPSRLLGKMSSIEKNVYKTRTTSIHGPSLITGQDHGPLSSPSYGEEKGNKYSWTKQVFTAGRPPWYNTDGQLKEAFVIGVAGGSASGKTTVTRKIIENLGVPWVVLLSMDSFYKDPTKEQLEKAYRNEFNFDHPDVIDFDLIVKTLRKLKKGKKVTIPIYDFTTHRRLTTKEFVYGANVIVFEGILAFCHKELNDLMDMKIFVDTDADIRLARRLKRDIEERGRDLVGTLKQYDRFVKPAFDEFIQPTMRLADVIIPRGADNHVAIDLITKLIARKLEEQGFVFRETLASIQPSGELPPSVHVLKSTSQVKALSTLIRDRETGRDDFVFYSQRLIRLLVEQALQELTYIDKNVITPVDQSIYHGKESNDQIMGVSIIRAGTAMEIALRKVIKDVKIGKLLIQTDQMTGEPQLHYCKFPLDIFKYKVLLMDATIATGAAAIMAIRVLLDHEVPEENIIFITVIGAINGLYAVAYAFPRVIIVVGEMDHHLNEQFHILPGIGNFGNRYFGT